ncbi:MAG: GNAT family N-acetyltransferase [Flavobacteriales bacterium]|nr:GNAT family N-acetyltransferase [Flavobacteriales bacterium]
MNINELDFRRLDLNSVRILVQWAADEGWNPGIRDAELFWNADPEGFYGFYREEELIAGGSIVSYGALFGFMGLFIVKPEYRGAGIGRELWYQRRNKLLRRLKPDASIGMDGVVVMQEFYHQGGFELVFRDERYERTGESLSVDARVRIMQASDRNSILNMDRMCFGYDRSDFIIPWLAPENGPTFCYFNGEELLGFAHLRPCLQGYKIGPLFAENYHVAEALYRSCLNSVPGEPVYLDIPVVNESAVQLVSSYKARYVFECGRMYYGTPPPLPTAKIFGITSFELG